MLLNACLSNDEDKASAFYSYFSSVFTIDDSSANNVDDQDNVINKTNFEISLSEIEFNDHSMYKAVDNLNIYKSARPDGLHPSILFETRNVISTPLRIIFEAFMRMKQLPKADDTPDFCCATLLCNLLCNKVARFATMPNAAATKLATSVASSGIDDDV